MISVSRERREAKAMVEKNKVFCWDPVFTVRSVSAYTYTVMTEQVGRYIGAGEGRLVRYQLPLSEENKAEKYKAGGEWKQRWHEDPPIL